MRRYWIKKKLTQAREYSHKCKLRLKEIDKYINEEEGNIIRVMKVSEDTRHN